jgi:septin family protein
VNLHLTIVDTPGFGDAIDNSNCWDSVNIYAFCIEVFFQVEEFAKKCFP